MVDQLSVVRLEIGLVHDCWLPLVGYFLREEQ